MKHFNTLIMMMLMKAATENQMKRFTETLFEWLHTKEANYLYYTGQVFFCTFLSFIFINGTNIRNFN